VLLMRTFSVFFLLFVVRDKLFVLVGLSSYDKPFKDKVAKFTRSFGLADVYFVALAFFLWIFPNEVGALFYLLLVLLLFVYAGLLVYKVLRDSRHPSKLFYKMYSHPLYRGAMFGFLFTLVTLTSLLIAMNFNSSDSSSYQPPKQSVFTASIHAVTDYLLSLYWLPLAIILVIGFLCTIVYVITLIRYMRMRRLRKSAIRGDAQASDRIISIALDKSKWLQIRERAIKTLPLLEVPGEHIKELESLISIYPELSRELERTVYELRAQTLKSSHAF